MSKRELVDAYVDGRIDRRTFMRRMAAAGVSVAAAGTLAGALRPAAAGADPADVADATVIPVPATVPPGDPSHDYPFFASQFDLAARGYVEEEFFLEGTAATYATANGQLTTAEKIDDGHPYRTRMVVRRPRDQRRFNGTVVVEWYNVTVGFDVEANWFRYYDHIMRAGYAWVGVSAQRVGVNALREWSPGRYGTLDVTEGGTITNDALGWDIYSQALKAIIAPQGVAPLGPLTASRLIADGESSSAARLTLYYNAIHPLVGLADAFILNGAPEPNLVVRTDLATPVLKILTETDVEVIGHAQNRQPDSSVLRTWEVTGTGHVDADMLGLDHLTPTAPGINPVQWRDTGTFQAPECDFPTLPRTPFKYVYHAAIDHVDRWIRTGAEPPHGTPLEVLSVGPGPRDAVLARDEFGIALGGIRLPHVDVPIAVNASPNGPGFFCSIFGQYRPFDQETLDRLYPNHGSYVSKVVKVADRNVRDGFVLRQDAQAMKQEAAQSDIGR